MSTRADIFIEGAGRRHGFDAWRGRSRLGFELFIWRYALRGDELPGWSVERLRPIRAPGWPPMYQAIWRAPRAGGAVQVTTFECPSRSSAHMFLLRTLANVQSPLVARRDELPVGDIAFTDRAETAVLFARANLVVLGRVVGGTPRPVVGAVQQIDAGLIEAPPEAATRAMALLRFTPTDEHEDVARLTLPVAATAAALRAAPMPMYKFYSPSGEVYREDDAILYRAASPGDQVVRVYEVHAGAPPATTAVPFVMRAAPRP
jgi:hypothetical protein